MPVKTLTFRMKVAKVAALVMAAAVKVLRAALAGLAVATGLAVFKMAALGESVNQAMQQSLAIMGPVSKKMRKLMTETAIDVARTTTSSAKQASDSYFFLASAGLNAAQSLAALPVVAKFAQAGMFNMALATDLLTDAQTSLGLSSKDAAQNMLNMARIADVLVKANTTANASVQQFSEALTNKAGAALKAAGKDIEEGISILAAFAAQGVKGAEAGTAFAIVMRELKQRAIQNTVAFERMRIAVFDNAGGMRNLSDIIRDLEDALAGMSVELRTTTLMNLGFQAKSVGFLEMLIGMSEATAAWEASSRSAGGSLDLVANKQMTGFMKSWELLKAALASDALKPLVFAAMVAAQALAGVLMMMSDLVHFIERVLGGIGRIISFVASGAIFGKRTKELEQMTEAAKDVDKAMKEVAESTKEAAKPQGLSSAARRLRARFEGMRRRTSNEESRERRVIELSLRSPTEVFDQEMARLNKLFDGGKKNAEVFGMAVARLRDEFVKSSKAGKEATRLQSLRVDVLERIKTPMARFLESMGDLSGLFVAGLLNESQLDLAAKQLKESLLPTAELAGGGPERAGSRIISNLRDVIPGGGGGKKQSVFDEEAKRQREQSLIELRNISRSIASGGRLTVPAGT